MTSKAKSDAKTEAAEPEVAAEPVAAAEDDIEVILGDVNRANFQRVKVPKSSGVKAAKLFHAGEWYAHCDDDPETGEWRYAPESKK